MRYGHFCVKIQALFMNRTSIISFIEEHATDDDLAILRSARFKKKPLKAAWFYFLVSINRYTPFLIPISGKTLWEHTLDAYETSAIGSIYFLGYYDRDITLFLLKQWKDTGDLLDVGGNVGVYTSLFSYLAAPAGVVTAFEPTPSTFTLLKKNTIRLKNVKCEEIALSSSAGTIEFYDYGYQHGVFNSAKAQPLEFLEKHAKKITVATNTIDAYCEASNSKPSLIKLDTEGTEAELLEHAAGTLEKYQPMILLEVGGGEAWSENNTRSLEMLSTAGYSFYTATSEGALTIHTPQASYQYQNLIAIHKSKSSAYEISG